MSQAHKHNPVSYIPGQCGTLWLQKSQFYQFQVGPAQDSMESRALPSGLPTESGSDLAGLAQRVPCEGGGIATTQAPAHALHTWQGMCHEPCSRHSQTQELCCSSTLCTAITPKTVWKRNPEMEVRSFSKVFKAVRMRSNEVDFQQNSTW